MYEPYAGDALVFKLVVAGVFLCALGGGTGGSSTGVPWTRLAGRRSNTTGCRSRA